MDTANAQNMTFQLRSATLIGNLTLLSGINVVEQGHSTL